MNLQRNDPESLAIWNHPVYMHYAEKHILDKDQKLIDDVLIAQNQSLIEEIKFMEEQRAILDKFTHEMKKKQK